MVQLSPSSVEHVQRVAPSGLCFLSQCGISSATSAQTADIGAAGGSFYLSSASCVQLARTELERADSLGTQAIKDALRRLVELMEEWQLILTEKARGTFHEPASSAAAKSVPSEPSALL